jgi:plasmid stabilization system protein ParE
MPYELRISPLAEADIDESIAFYVAEGSTTVAAKWVAGLTDCMRSLREMPGRCSLAPENDDLEFELRQIRFKSHRVLFTIVEPDTVVVLRVYHSARQPSSLSDL